jgi:cob(I)alamin adenosyltransferase
MQPVSTKQGDQGLSGLANGQRLGKDELVFEVLGTLDELNSWLGYCRVELKNFVEFDELLATVQGELFQMGAEFAQSPISDVSLLAKHLQELESKSMAWQKKLSDAWTVNFLYPGGVEAAARLDIARTVCRRLERLVVGYSRQLQAGAVRPLVLQYLNRLSDVLFVMRCQVNLESQHTEKKFIRPGTRTKANPKLKKT